MKQTALTSILATLAFLIAPLAPRAQEPQPAVFWVSMPYQPLTADYQIVWVKIDDTGANLEQQDYGISLNDETGEISGQICNNFRGNFKATMAGTVSVGPIISTKKICLSIADESAILKALENADSFHLEQDMLGFFTAGKMTLRLRKKSETAETKPAIKPISFPAFDFSMQKIWYQNNWVDLTGFETSFHIDAQANQISGKGLCNRFFGQANLGPEDDGLKGKASFGQLVSTLMACPQLELEQAIFNAIQQTDSFSITGNTLNLVVDSRTVLVLEKK